MQDQLIALRFQAGPLTGVRPATYQL